jgi:hypothetical protein
MRGEVYLAVPSSVRKVLHSKVADRLIESILGGCAIGPDYKRPAVAEPPTFRGQAVAEALAAFHFPDDLWARLIYDLVIAARSSEPPIEQLVAALVPIYFGRVGSFVIENRNQTTDQAEDRVERQAREFELLKPYLVERWEEASAPANGTEISKSPAEPWCRRETALTNAASAIAAVPKVRAVPRASVNARSVQPHAPDLDRSVMFPPEVE